ncbi:MAG: excinuclease ABC subunit UvrA, partial [Promethearchaeota archaeon]
QKKISNNPRSIVATVTEIYDYFRLLFANIGVAHCPVCGNEISPKSSQEITDEILKILKEGTKFKVLAPIIRGKKGTYEKLLNKLKKQGYSRVIISDEGHEPIEYLLDEPISMDKYKKHTIEVIVDRLIFRNKGDGEFKSRLANAIETSLKLANGLVTISILNGESKTFSEDYFCTQCGISYSKLLPRDFSFNTPYGACPYCKGLGSLLEFDEDKIFPDKDLTIVESRIKELGGFGSIDSTTWQIIQAVGEHYNIDIFTTPIKDYPEEIWDKFLYGSGSEKIFFNLKIGNKKFKKRGSKMNGGTRDGVKSNDQPEQGNRLFVYSGYRPFEGIINTLQRRYMQTKSEDVRNYYEKYMSERVCSACKGQRLKPESLAVTVRGRNIWDICKMSVKEGYEWTKKLNEDLNDEEKVIARDIMKEILARYSFLYNVGLDYITLDRKSRTLSGGESERIRLATQIGSNLVEVLYVLDEPTIGLHERDKRKLINMLKELRNKGNSVLIVEHDEDVIREADFIVDLGPKAGVHGGYIVEAGPIEKIMKNTKSLTGQYLSGKMSIPIPTDKRKPSDKWIKIFGARENNLKNINVEIPLGLFVCITGVSGAGKSSLIDGVLLSAYSVFKSKKDLSKYKHWRSLPFDNFEGFENIDKLIYINQDPIGRTPKSVPCTYTKVFDEIRELFAQTDEAKIRGYNKGRFSFNLKGGRCEKCQGKGYNLIEMHFLPDVYIKCDLCKGKRYNEETLEVKYKGKNIYEILEMTHDEAYEFFKNHRRIRSILKTVIDVGLGYLKLGQSSTTLSGGEAQRIKLSRELSKRSTGNTLYVLDEPTTGLHFHDVRVLIDVLQKLVDKGNSVIIIEHNLDVIKSADYIIDLGPEGGDNGGEIVATGPPEEIIKKDNSYTGLYLKRMFQK